VPRCQLDLGQLKSNMRCQKSSLNGVLIQPRRFIAKINLATENFRSSSSDKKRNRLDVSPEAIGHSTSAHSATRWNRRARVRAATAGQVAIHDLSRQRPAGSSPVVPVACFSWLLR